MRTAIIGTGFVAAIHAQVLNELGHQITWVINPHREKADEFARRYGAKHAGSTLQEALQTEIDVVHICTPPASHYELIKAALMARLHVFCEKPLCLQPAQAMELYSLAQRQQRLAAVNFNVRFHEVCAIARETITAPSFGQPHLIHGSYLQEFHVLPQQYSWRYQPEQAGPMRAVTEIGSHWIDLVRYWTGLEIIAVSASFGKFASHRVLTNGLMEAALEPAAANLRVDSEDAAIVSLRFSNGAIGSLFLSEVSHGRANQLTMEVCSANKSIWWNTEEPYQLHQAQKFSGTATQTFPFGGGFTGTFHDCIAAFYHGIHCTTTSNLPLQQPRYATFLDGAMNAAVCDAIYKSATQDAAWIGVAATTDSLQE